MKIEALVFDSGLCGPVWDMDVKFISKYVHEHSWLYSSVEYNVAHEIQINIEHGTLHRYKENNTSIMCKAGGLFKNISELKSVNRVKILHKVLILSDIKTAAGRC